MCDEFGMRFAQWGVLRRAEHLRHMLGRFGDFKRAWHEITPRFFRELGLKSPEPAALFRAREAYSFELFLERARALEVSVLSLDDPAYPALLKHIADPPPFLFVRGRLPEPDHFTFAVVGTRRMSAYGRFATRRLVSGLARAGMAIVSGLALGVDGCAHETALENGAYTLAVLGSGVDQVIPPAHEALGQRILAAGGALVSEYPLGAPGFKAHFPERNRLIAGLSRGVLVTEGGVRSGALITARLAFDENRAVYAVPCNITAHDMSGTNALVKSNRAKLVECPQDILEDYAAVVEVAGPAAPADANLPIDSPDALLALLKARPRTLEQLAAATGQGAATLSVDLMRLQLQGVAEPVGLEWVYRA